MAKYRKNYKKGNTNFAKASYSEIYDIQTDTDRATILGIHSPMSNTPYLALKGFFTQFVRFKYVGADVTLVPASTLPADPLQLSYESGESTIDPRDMLNPILMRGVHGSDLPVALRRALPQGTVIGGSEFLQVGYQTDTNDPALASIDIANPADITATSTALSQTAAEKLYYALLTDPSWKKSSIQSGARMKLYPLVQKLVGQTEIAPFDYTTSNLTSLSATGNLPDDDAVSSYLGPDVSEVGSTSAAYNSTSSAPAEWARNGFYDYSVTSHTQVYPIYSNGWTRLGWLPTHPPGLAGGSVEQITYLPRIMMACIMMPPAYKQEFYFRVVVKHHFLFKDYQPANLLYNGAAVDFETTQYYSSSSTTSTTSSVDLYDTESDTVTDDSESVSLVGEFASVD